MPPAVSRPGRIVVLASGTGSLFEALVRDCRSSGGQAEVTRLVCDQPAAGVLARAEAMGVPATVVPLVDRSRRAEWDVELAEAIAAGQPDLVVSAGFMRLLGAAVLDRFPQRVINTHPALLPSFPGTHGVRDALAHGVRITGTTVHVVDSGVDTGPIIDQRAVEILPGDDEDSLHERIKVVERRLLADTVLRMLREGWTIDGRRVTIP